MPPAEQLYAETLSLKGAVAALQGTLTAAQEEIAQLKVQIAWLKKRFYGPGLGETLDRAQMLLQIEGVEKLAARLATPT